LTKFFSNDKIFYGITGLSAGLTIGIVEQTGILAIAQKPELFVGLTLVLIFGYVLGIYGMVVFLVLNSNFSRFALAV
jgi:V-type H+-transporting ATPase proteolipid subunit